MISSKAVWPMTFVIIAVAGNCISAAEQTAVEFYGQGVHAYFAADYDSAIATLTKSIEKDDHDPRAFYFRGLALASRDGLDAGTADLAKGADLEMDPVDKRLFGVNSALQRVQGKLRLALEKQRTIARLATAERKKKRERVKYEKLRRREDIVLFQPDLPIKKVNFELPVVELGDKDPFASGSAFSGGNEVVPTTPTLVVEPATPITEPTDGNEPRNPFAGKPEATENPFGDLAPAEVPADVEEKSGVSNPFGDDMAEVAPDDPIFDDNVRPELPPGMNVGGTIIDLIGRTLSEKPDESQNRDPFADDDPVDPPKVDPPADDAGAQGDKKIDPNVNPFD